MCEFLLFNVHIVVSDNSTGQQIVYKLWKPNYFIIPFFKYKYIYTYTGYAALREMGCLSVKQEIDSLTFCLLCSVYKFI